jgi:hypothetical protein
MSQALLLRMNALEGRVKALEGRLAELEAPMEGPRYRAVHGGFGHWFVKNPEGTKMNTEGLEKEEAQRLADEFNGITEAIGA